MKAFPPKERQGVYRAILNRRDVHAFRPDPILPGLLARLLHVANQSPSVGFIQPWSFIVITDPAIKQQVHAVVRENEHATDNFYGEHRDMDCGLTPEGILDAPIHLCIAYDPRHFGPEIIGRRTIRDVISVGCAIENLWLAARAEGIGVNWVNISHKKKLRDILAIPRPIVPVAYLGLGHPVSLANRFLWEPLDYTPRRRLANLVYGNIWGGREGMDELIRHLHKGNMVK